jgi:hypothetical protein
MFDDGTAIRESLALLGASLEAQGTGPYEIVVVGGAALITVGFRVRSTRDVDVLALLEQRDSSELPVLVKEKPLPAPLLAAAARVAHAFGLDEDWLNPGPADLLDHGLPGGFVERLTAETFGPRLTVWFPCRQDLICLKTYAAADTGPGRHLEDLTVLAPSCEELWQAVQWTRTHDPSDSFRTILIALLRHFGCLGQAEELQHE